MKKFTTYLLLFLFWAYGSMAQNTKECPEIKNRNVRNLYQSSLDLLAMKRDTEAYQMLQQVVNQEPNYAEAWFILADLDYQKARNMLIDSITDPTIEKNLIKAEYAFGRVIKICPAFRNYLAYFFLGEFYYDLHDFNKARIHLDNYLEFSTDTGFRKTTTQEYLGNIETYRRLINNPVPFSPKSLEGVSTVNDEYLPIMSPDGDYLFYTHRYKKKLYNYPVKQEVEEFTFSKRLTEPGEDPLIFSPGEAMPYPFNTEGRNEGGATITIDNKHIYITICEVKRAEYTSYRNCDIFVSDFVNGNWTNLKNLGPNINRIDTWEGQPSITSDGRVLFFASARPEGFGGIDIYRSVKKLDGEWSPAENLGAVINTSGDDKTPFIHSDSQTLYFASNGHFGLGSFDIFYSQFTNDSGWSKPRNLGYPINTKKDEVGFIVSTNGKKLYFGSNQYGGQGGYDIYSADLYKEVRPKRILFVKGQLYDNKGEHITNAQVELTSTKSFESTEGLVDQETGKYAVTVVVKDDEKFIMTAKKRGYLFNSTYIDPDDEQFDPPTTVNLEVSPIQTGVPIRLNNVTFRFNSSVLDETSKLCINNLTDFLIENPEMAIELRGHTDNIGESGQNQYLSYQRAKSVRNYLIAKGIIGGRIKYAGYGESQPIASNATEAGRAENRRVEFIILPQ